ncbi:MAG: hypothetical protein JW739_05715 [Opitutales bacterium]|nr:hypothetical protein [Opitutales bacterium]
MKRSLLLFIACSLMLTGCGTIVPEPVASATVSYDGNEQIGGLKRILTVGNQVSGYIITEDARLRYNNLLKIYSEEIYGRVYEKDYGLCLMPDNSWLITAEALTMFITMNQVRRMDGVVTE